MLIPMQFEQNFPVIGEKGKVPKEIQVPDTGYCYEKINGSDDFSYLPDEKGEIHLKCFWEWNHQSIDTAWSVTENPGHLRIHSEKISSTL